MASKPSMRLYPHQQAFLDAMQEGRTVFIAPFLSRTPSTITNWNCKMIDNGLSDIIQELKRFNFDVREMNPEETVSERAGFEAVKNGVTLRYDGTLYVNNEPLETPWGEFDIAIQDHVTWFLENQDRIVTHLASKYQHESRGNIVGGSNK